MTKRQKKAKQRLEKRSHNNPKRDNDVTTPPVIPLTDESNDLMEAATMKIKPTSDQAANDPTINTASADDPKPVVSYDEADDNEPQTKRYPTGELVYHSDYDGNSVAPATAPKNAELIEQAVAEMAAEQNGADHVIMNVTLRIRDDIGNGLKYIHNNIVNGWIAFGDWADRSVTNFYAWCYRQSETLKEKREEWFSPKVTRSELVECMRQFGEILLDSQAVTQDAVMMILNRLDGKNTIDASRLNVLLDAVKKGHNIKAATTYRELTGVTLTEAKSRIEEYA